MHGCQRGLATLIVDYSLHVLGQIISQCLAKYVGTMQSKRGNNHSGYNSKICRVPIVPAYLRERRVRRVSFGSFHQCTLEGSARPTSIMTVLHGPLLTRVIAELRNF